MAISFDPYASVASILADFDTRLAIGGSITLDALTLSPNTGTTGVAYSGTVTGKTASSALSLTGAGAAGLNVSGTTVSGTPTTAGAVDIVETLTGATNNPRTSSGVLNVVAAGAAAPTPTNSDIIWYGDSRFENHGTTATLNTSGFSPQIFNRGVPGWIGALSNHKLRSARYSSFAIGGGSAQQAAPLARLAANGTETTGTWWRGSASGSPTSGSNNKGWLQAGQHPAGIVCILIEANGFVAGTGAGSTYAAILTSVNGILSTDPTKTIWLLNGIARGVANDGSFTNDLGTGAPALEYAVTAANLMKLSFDSGDAAALPRVVAFDTMTLSRNPAETNAVRNYRGWQVDGLHPSAYGAWKITQFMVDRIATVHSAWYSALPVLAPLPTSSGLSSQGKAVGDAQPYLNRNAVMVAGNNGAVSGTFATAPTAATIPEGITLIGVNTGGVSVVCDKTTVPGEFRLQISGTSGSAQPTTTSIELRQTVSGADLTTLTGAGQFSLSDKLRALVRRAIAPGSQNLSGAYVRVVVTADTATKNRIGLAGLASAFGKINDFLDGADGTYRTLATDVLDLVEPNMQTSPGAITSISSMLVSVYLDFATVTSGETISADIRITHAGVYRSAS